MATPIKLTDVNGRYTPKVGEPFDVHIRDYKLGNRQTIEVLSCWEFTPSEFNQVIETGFVFLRLYGAQPPVCMFNAEITEFEGQNAIFRLGHCNDLPTFTRKITYAGEEIDEITSAWRLNPQGIADLKERGYIHLSVVGGMTDVKIFGINPIRE
ncbi:hypothetical protein GCM10028805_22630 [Spirosoma harenae]